MGRAESDGQVFESPEGLRVVARDHCIGDAARYQQPDQPKKNPPSVTAPTGAEGAFVAASSYS